MIDKNQRKVVKLVKHLNCKRVVSLRDRRAVNVSNIKAVMHKESVNFCYIVADAHNDTSPHKATYPCKIVLHYKFADTAQIAADQNLKLRVICETMVAQGDNMLPHIADGETFLFVADLFQAGLDEAPAHVLKRLLRLERDVSELQTLCTNLLNLSKTAPKVADIAKQETP